MNAQETRATFLAVLAAALYSLSSPFSKILLGDISPTLMAALLYIGAGIGVFVLMVIRSILGKGKSETHILRSDFPYVIGMVVLDVAAPILLMYGLSMSNAATVSLLGNFEIVATAFIASILFKEHISTRLWTAIFFITISCILLSTEADANYTLSIGSILALAATTCWGLENNCTRMLSMRDPMEVVVIKGFCSGFGSLCIAASFGQISSSISHVFAALFLGFIAYGLSIFFYVSAQRYLGAARTSTFYAVGPFIGVVLSFFLFGTPPNSLFPVALSLMIVGTYLSATNPQTG
ncbi:DMT family transporter [Coprothermobacter platensis]|uniref:DMT family transporter n=1 Tax=Coprothermobacter platensis TaxID=108819 RepID=UPI00037763A7|nr:DMT family transporter [Coprothermobacter platensis]